MATDRIKLGGLWVNRSKDGREYLTGKLSPTVKILIFKNDFKTTDNQPSHVMYLAPVETDETQRQNTPAPDSFFGAAEGGRGESSPGGGFADDDFFPEEDAAPLPAAPVSRAPRPAPTPAEAGSRVVPQGQGQAPRRGGSSGQPPAQTRPQVGAPQPPRNDGNDRDDMTDPFDE